MYNSGEYYLKWKPLDVTVAVAIRKNVHALVTKIRKCPTPSLKIRKNVHALITKF